MRWEGKERNEGEEGPSWENRKKTNLIQNDWCCECGVACHARVKQSGFMWVLLHVLPDTTAKHFTHCRTNRMSRIFRSGLYCCRSPCSLWSSLLFSFHSSLPPIFVLFLSPSLFVSLLTSSPFLLSPFSSLALPLSLWLRKSSLTWGMSCDQAMLHVAYHRLVHYTSSVAHRPKDRTWAQ